MFFRIYFLKILKLYAPWKHAEPVPIRQRVQPEPAGEPQKGERAWSQSAWWRHVVGGYARGGGALEACAPQKPAPDPRNWQCRMPGCKHARRHTRIFGTYDICRFFVYFRYTMSGFFICARFVQIETVRLFLLFDLSEKFSNKTVLYDWLRVSSLTGEWWNLIKYIFFCLFIVWKFYYVFISKWIVGIEFLCLIEFSLFFKSL